jgi:hypothetical protein
VKPCEIRQKRKVLGGKQDALYLGSMLPGCYGLRTLTFLSCRSHHYCRSPDLVAQHHVIKQTSIKASRHGGASK